MKSSSNTYLTNLDHLRAFAAFMVFIWHFVHFSPQCPQMECTGGYHIKVPFLSLLEQGYTGVALFMCISGYIFTYLTFGKKLHIGKFWYNRILRLFPLILFWGILESFNIIGQLYGMGMSLDHVTTMLSLLIHPQGAWTVYIELQYYLALPLILLGIRRFGATILPWFLVLLIATRAAIWYHTGSVQYLSYWTIVGHADQFVLGMAAFHLEQWIQRSSPHPKRTLRLIGLAGIAGIILLYQYIASQGGYSTSGPFSESIFWVFLPSLEGTCYGMIIISYLQCNVPALLSKPLSALGRWSYSIYLDHFQLVPFLYIYAITRFKMGDDFYNRLVVATLLVFPLVLFFSAATYGIIEKPFLRLRRNYLLPQKQYESKNP